MTAHLHLLKVEVGNSYTLNNAFSDTIQISHPKSRRIVVHMIFEPDIIQIELPLPCFIRKVFLSINVEPSQVLKDLMIGVILRNDQPSIPCSQMLGCLERKAGEVSPLGNGSAFVSRSK